MTIRPPSTTTDDDSGDRLAQALVNALPSHPGSLTLVFESGRPRARKPFDLATVDAVTLGRASDRSRANVSEVGREQRLVLELEDRRLSHVHAHMRRLGDGWQIEDAGSKNGTRVNGGEVMQARLQTGDLVEVGRSFFVFQDERPHSAIHELPRGALGLTTANPRLARQFDDLAAIAPSAIAVLVQGETGTGKELVARAVHQLSGRTGPLRAVNCGALPRTLLESELFGYRKGAFSGATEDRPGLVRSADKGTLFLDEIGDLALDAQAALLRVLQEGEVVPLGTVKPIPVDVRVVAATHRDLQGMVAAHRFRADLLARLAGFTVTLPPLRARREDMGQILHALLEKHAPAAASSTELSPAAIRALFAYPWPANVRELEKVITSALLLARGKIIDLEHLPEAVRAQAAKGCGPATGPSRDDDDTRERVVALLVRHGGNVTAVAAEMKTSRMQVHRLCKRFGVDLRAYRTD